MDSGWGIFGIVVFAIVAIVAIYAAGGWLVSVAWNLVIPYVFALPPINWVQGIAMSFLMAQLAGFNSRTYNAVVTDRFKR